MHFTDVLYKLNNNPEMAFVSTDFEEDPAMASKHLSYLYKKQQIDRRPYNGPVKHIRFEYYSKKQKNVETPIQPDQKLEEYQKSEESSVLIEAISTLANEPVIESVHASSATSLIELIRKIVKEVISDELNSIISNANDIVNNKTHSVISTPTPPKLTKVLLIGLLPNQENIIKNEYSDMFELVFANRELPGGVLKGKASKCANTLVLTDFISHTVEKALSRVHGYVRVSGGISSLRVELNKIIKEQHNNM